MFMHESRRKRMLASTCGSVQNFVLAHAWWAHDIFFFYVCYFRIFMHTIHVAFVLELGETMSMHVCLFGCWTDQINFLCIYIRCVFGATLMLVLWIGGCSIVGRHVLFFSYTLLCPVI